MKNYYLKSLLSVAIVSLSVTVLSGCGATLTNNNQPTYQQPVMTDQALTNELMKHKWQLKSAINTNKQPITEITQIAKPAELSLHQQGDAVSLRFGAGCNDFGGSVKVLNSMLISNAMMSTKKYCAHLNKAEQQLSGLMKGMSQVTVSHSNGNVATLTQITADGSTLIWQGEPTTTSKYGEGETIFLEVDGKMQHCSSGINQQCMKVREIYYDMNSVKSGTSDWKLMKQHIKGYTHNEKTHNVLRVKKHITESSDVKGKQLVYVLDMVVETSAAE